MNTTELLTAIENRNFIEFQECWHSKKNESTENERQLLITEILDDFYQKSDFSFFVKVFDEILKTKTSLDFAIDHWAPSFLSLAVHKCSKKLFMYFLSKGANINFIADSFLFLDENEKDCEDELLRYDTCLDFADLKLGDKLSVDYNFSAPDIDIDELKQNESSKEIVSISKDHYFNLLEQSIYLQDIVHLDRVRDYMISSGAKTYEELKNK